jgi:hypothetical protein
MTGQVTTGPSHHHPKWMRAILVFLVRILVLDTSMIVGIMKRIQKRVVPVLQPLTSTNTTTTVYYY